MREIYLYGAAGRRFGKRFRLDVASPREALRALFALRPGLQAFMRPGWWRVIVGDVRTGHRCEAGELAITGQGAIHIVPVVNVAGGRRGSIIGIIIGVILIAVVTIATWGAGTAPTAAGWSAAMSTYTVAGITYGQILMMGVGLVLAGVAGLVAPVPKAPKATDKASADNRPSFLFNGATNISEQGAPVPVVLGEFTTGSVVIGAAMDIEDLGPGDTEGASTPPKPLVMRNARVPLGARPPRFVTLPTMEATT